MKKLKRALIKEELVELTGDFKLAIVLNQMIYWSERVRDFDKFIKEEIERYRRFGTADVEQPKMKLTNGWIYKKAEELSEETMMNVRAKAMRDYLKELVEKGWLEERRNPYIPMDRTLQYRVNLIKIQRDLLKLGYSLEGYSVDLSFIKETLNEQEENSNFLKENSNEQFENRRVEKERAIPEITTKISSSSGSSEQTSTFENFVNEYLENFEECKPFAMKYLKDLYYKYGHQLTLHALRQATLMQNVKNPPVLIETILKNWGKNDISNIEDLIVFNRQRKERAEQKPIKESRNRKTGKQNTLDNYNYTPDRKPTGKYRDLYMNYGN